MLREKMLWGGGEEIASIVAVVNRWSPPMQTPNDLSQSRIYRRSPDQLSEEEVRAYILNRRERGAARGTFKANYYGIRYLYRYTLNRDWALFSKKTSACRGRSVCPTRLPTPRSAGCLAA
jgi:hypothetical protein